jgi:hypothetical protein
MFRLLGVILRPSIDPKQDYLITSALWDPVALTIGGINAVWNYSQVSKMTRARLRIVPKTHHYNHKVTSTEPTIILETWE